MIIDPDPDGIHRRRLRSNRSRPRPGRRSDGRSGGRWWAWLFGVPCLLIVLSALMVASLRVINPPQTAFMLAARIDAALEGRRPFNLQYRWVDARSISPWAGVAVIAAEDQKFPHHHGFDLDALEDALAAHREGARLRGASTVSQQLAKNLFLWSGRSWLRKALEAWFTILLEVCLPKGRILEIYLNVVEFGDGIYGVDAASSHYFGHPPATLSVQESAALAAVLPSPRRYSVTAPSLYVRGRQAWIRDQMTQLGGTSVLSTLMR